MGSRPSAAGIGDRDHSSVLSSMYFLTVRALLAAPLASCPLTASLMVSGGPSPQGAGRQLHRLPGDWNGQNVHRCPDDQGVGV